MNASFDSFTPLNLAYTTQFKAEFCAISHYQGISSLAGCTISSALWERPLFDVSAYSTALTGVLSMGQMLPKHSSLFNKMTKITEC